MDPSAPQSLTQGYSPDPSTRRSSLGSISVTREVFKDPTGPMGPRGGPAISWGGGPAAISDNTWGKSPSWDSEKPGLVQVARSGGLVRIGLP